MPKNQDIPSIIEIGHTSRDQKYRHSLQPKSAVVETPFRHTQSQNYSAKKKRVKTKVPPIPELEATENDTAQIAMDIKQDQVKVVLADERNPKHSKGSRKSSQTSSRIGFDNAAFEPDKDGVRISRSNSAGNSLRSSLRNPSVQSLTVVREQYCCCSRWTPCERALFAAVGVLTFIIVILVVTIILVSINHNGVDEKASKSRFKNIFDF